jgi:hypothetical protein
VETPGEAAAALLDAQGTVAGDLACRRCGYNLRGLNHAGRCPECGTPVGLSCHGDLLRFADPAWLAKLARGASFVLWGVLVALLAGGVGGLASYVTRSRSLAALIAFVGGLVGLYGAWLMTEPDPSNMGEDKYVNDRRVVRFALLVGLGSQVVNFMLSSLPLPPWIDVILAAIGLLVGLIWVIGEFAKLGYFRKLALRIPDPVLARRANRLRWALMISLGTLVVAGGLMGFGTYVAAPAGAPSVGYSVTSISPSVPAGASTRVGPIATRTGVSVRSGRLPVGFMALGCVTALASLANVIVTILILILVYRLRRAFREQAQIALGSWAEAGVATP